MNDYDHYIKHIAFCFDKINEILMVQSFDEYITSIPTFYYMGIGSANLLNEWPASNNRQEYPDYVRDYNYERKVLILIDYAGKKPLSGSEHELILIDSTDILVGLNNDMPVYEYYHSVEINNHGYPKLEVYVIRQYIQLLEYRFNPRNLEQIYIKHRMMLVNLVNNALEIHNDSLFLVNSFNGYPNYNAVDEILSLFPLDKQEDCRKRFLLEGTYNVDHGCYYDLTQKTNQPIIENGRFYNPGMLSIMEYNDALRNLLESKNSIDDVTFSIKKRFMLTTFNKLLRQVFDDQYREFRCAMNEMKKSDPELMPFLRQEMLFFVEKILQAIHSFVNIPSFIERQRVGDIYSDETEIKKIINGILN